MIASSESFIDEYVMIVGSRKWGQVAEGSSIPEWNAQLTISDTHLTHLNTAKWYWRWYVRLAEWFVTRFPEWVCY